MVAQERPKTAPGRPQDSSKMAPKWPNSRPRASLTLPGPRMTALAAQRSRQESPRTALDPPKDPHREPKRASKGPVEALS